MRSKKNPPGAGRNDHSNVTTKRGLIMVDHSLEVQRRRLLEALRQNSITTLEARQDLDIMHPGGRVYDLRRQGFPIVTTWTRQQGHRIGQYSLLLPRHAAQGGSL